MGTAALDVLALSHRMKELWRYQPKRQLVIDWLVNVHLTTITLSGISCHPR